MEGSRRDVTIGYIPTWTIFALKGFVHTSAGWLPDQNTFSIEKHSKFTHFASPFPNETSKCSSDWSAAEVWTRSSLLCSFGEVKLEKCRRLAGMVIKHTHRETQRLRIGGEERRAEKSYKIPQLQSITRFSRIIVLEILLILIRIKKLKCHDRGKENIYEKKQNIKIKFVNHFIG